ncbi:general substrate transporter [Gymnopilus junonius]|uniref:General substrate transporter n=1 Tax=Gymnopilus junonius TaxID=109634 RepID=A0A9P5NFB6_GYMJU|nr:general substrate transporter [Gymnopilus junonius]
MAGGAGGTGGGIATTSLLWAIVMSAFAGKFPSFGGILFGYDTGTIGGCIAMNDWLQTFGKFDPTPGGLSWYIPTNDKSLVVSILSAGTFFGGLFASPMADLVGRKFGLIYSCLIFTLGVGLQLDDHWATFIVGRVIAGLGVGLVSCLVPMYQSECSPKSMRGAIVGLYQLAITIGALLAAIVLNATKDRPTTQHGEFPFPYNLFGLSSSQQEWCALLPESPRYLLLKGRHEEARRSIGRLMTLPPDAPEVEAEAVEITTALTVEQQASQGGYAACFKNNEDRNGWRTWTGILMQGVMATTYWHQLHFYYGTTFFQQAGIQNAFIIQIIADVVNTVMTIVGVNLIDRVGRRRLLLIGAAGMCISEYIVAIVGVTAGHPHAVANGVAVNLTAQRVLIAFTCIYIAFFAISWGPVIWVLTGEIFPLGIRAKSMSLAVASNWLWNFGIGYATPYLVNPTTTGVNGIKAANLGVKVFFIWGSTCIGCLIFTYFFIPETKGLSLEQIDLLYRESSIIGSNSHRQHIIDQDETFTNRFNEKAGHAKDDEKASA